MIDEPKDMTFKNIQLRDDERICPYCNCVNNIINDRCLECGKALSDREILREISSRDRELIPLSKRVKHIERFLLFSRVALLLFFTFLTVSIAREADRNIVVTLIIAASLMTIHGVMKIYSIRLNKSLIKKSENEVLRYKKENGFEVNDAIYLDENIGS